MPTPNEPDFVAIITGGTVFDNWSSYDIDSDLLTPADRWSVTLGMDAGSRVPPEITAGGDCVVRMTKEAVMRGVIDEVSHDVGRPAPSLSMSGRDGAAVLVDCSAPIFTAKEMTLDDVVKQIVRPLGIVFVDILADATQRREKVAIDPGITAWDALQQAAEANGLWPWFTPEGRLVIGGPDYSVDPVDTLVMRVDGQGNNLISLSHQVSMPGRYSEITVLGQGHGTATQLGKHNIKAAAKDSGITRYRPRIVCEGDVETTDAAQARARKLVADGRLNGLTLSAVVAGHRTASGALWTPGQRVRVQSEPHGIDDVFFLMARKFTGGRGRQTLTTLTLKEDGVWVLDARKKHRRKKKVGSKAKLTPVVWDVK
ncbi:phage baseplate assembly protein [Castellaniella caeni]|uniref:phage baseplate assembly protein n=1 Tax=Castellaniella caeni TaxID=266123 RepID=UPI000C9FCED0|nr:phage tail protein [Castellaniella caeni]